MPARAERAGRSALGGSDLAKRVISSAVLAPVGLVALASGGLLWDAVIAVAVAAAGFEWAGICRRSNGARNLLIAGSAAVTVCGAAGDPGWALALLAALMVVLRAIPAGGAALSCGAAYVAIPGLALVWLRAQPGGLAMTLLVMLTVWSSDTGAYIAGRAIGGPKLAPLVSPSKTWSGAAGGLLAACALGVAFGACVPRHLLPALHGPWDGALAAFLLGIASQFGDLLESAAKRRFGVKDSGRLIPGHGGLLDRVDGLIAAAPASILLLLAARGSMGG